MSARRRRALTAALLGLVAVLAFPGVLDPGRVFFQRDVASYWYPQADTFRAVVRSGAWPLWDPAEGFGTPMLGDPQSEVLYPPMWLTLLLSSETYYKLFAVSHLLLAGAGAYRWLRALGSPASSALAGAFVWMTAGPLLSFATMTQHFAGAAWMPWVLLALERLLRRRDAPSVVVLGTAAALQSLAGSADMCVMTGFVALLRLTLTTGGVGGHLRRCLAAAGLALGLAAAQWVPAAMVVRGSSRAQMAGVNTYWSLHPAHLVDLLALRLLTDAPVVPAVRAVVFESREPLVETLHLGPMALGLALAGALLGRRGAAVAAGALGFVALALGRFGPLSLVFAWPPFSLLRYPVKYLVPAALLGAWLVALAVERWRDPAAARRPFAIAAGALLLMSAAAMGACAWVTAHPDVVLPYLEGPLPPGATPASALLWPTVARASMACALGMVAALVLLARARTTRPGPSLAAAAVLLAVLGMAGAREANALASAEVVEPPPALALLRGDRVLSVRPPAARLNRDLRSQPGRSRAELFARGAHECLAPVTPARWGRRGSYDGDPTLLAPPAVSAATALVDRYLDTPFGLRLLRLGAVTDVAVCDDAVRLSLPPAGQAATVFPYPVRVIHVPGTLPRVRLVAAVHEVATADEAWHRLGSATFDPATEVVLETGRSAPRTEATAVGGVAVGLDRADRLEVLVDAPAPVVLVVADGWSPGWRAWIDGQPVPVRRANQLFRGVPVPAGRHAVTLAYRPPEVLAGLAVSALTALVAGSVLLRGRRIGALKPGTGAQ